MTETGGGAETGSRGRGSGSFEVDETGCLSGVRDRDSEGSRSWTGLWSMAPSGVPGINGGVYSGVFDRSG